MNEGIRTQKVEYIEDEIELIDILKVIWKWKYIIIMGTVFGTILAAIISFGMPKIYRIDMTLQPGFLNVTPRGEKLYIDSAENIKNIIESNAFKEEVLNNKSYKNDILKTLRLNVSVLKRSDIINISCETMNIETGINILKGVYESLRERNDELVEYYKRKYKEEIQAIKAEIAALEVNSKYFEQSIKNEQEKIKELESLIIKMANNNLVMINEKKKVLQNENNGEKSLLVVLYNTIIHQNQMMSNQYRNDIKEYLNRIENENKNNNINKIKKDKLYQDLKKLEFEKNSVHYVKILQHPTAIKYPIKPKIILNVILALVTGLFLMLFLAFFLEYLNKFKKSN